ncbi:MULTISPECIES: hypothetical protein [unclassified Helicobacter]|uniref:hypothetical protein n=1 Tax=unclassified Helicobacter TaxID=2593540 RepID=UPI00115FD399|nr:MULTISPECIES: hypothetical protein [unclassified Helicobacter]
MPRLKLIALISQIASKNTAWITDLKLQSHLEKGEVTLDLHITSARMDNITQLLYALKNEPSLQIIDENIESSAQMLDKDMLDRSAQHALDSSTPNQNTLNQNALDQNALNQNALDKDDLPNAKITLKLLYA